jgi:hypothetical protein
MQNIYKINSVTITPANINGVWYYRLYVNQQPVGDYTDIKLATDKLNSMVNEEKIENKQVEKFCTGCGTSSFKELGNNEHGEAYLACCPDNNYVELPTKQTRTFEMKVTIKASTVKAIDELLEMQQNVFSGELQRELEKEGFVKVTATFIEIRNGKR